MIPSPLAPAPFPIGAAFVARYPKTNFGVRYLESALFLMATFNAEEGVYCLAMPVDNDMAMILGREIFGYPKKMGNIYLEREGNDFRAGTERHGIHFLEIKSRLAVTCNDPGAQEFLMEKFRADPDIVVFNFKSFVAPERNGFDYNPRLIKETVKRRFKSMEFGKTQLIFNPSRHDPWSDVEIVRVLGATFSVSDNTMMPGEIVTEADPIDFAPFALMKRDDL